MSGGVPKRVWQGRMRTKTNQTGMKVQGLHKIECLCDIVHVLQKLFDFIVACFPSLDSNNSGGSFFG